MMTLVSYKVKVQITLLCFSAWSRGRGSTFKVIGPHNIVSKEVPPVGGDRPENF